MNAMIHCDGTLCLININDRGENDPPIHFAVKDGTKPFVCDNCSLQWCCDELFGVSNNHFCEYFAKQELGIDSRNFDKTGEFTDKETIILRHEYGSSEGPFPVNQLFKKLEPSMTEVFVSMMRE